jgi:hypothetical protein
MIPSLRSASWRRGNLADPTKMATGFALAMTNNLVLLTTENLTLDAASFDK